VLADATDWERNTGDGEHGGDDVVGRGGWGPCIGASEVHGQLVEGDALDDSVTLLLPMVNMKCQ